MAEGAGKSRRLLYLLKLPYNNVKGKGHLDGVCMWYMGKRELGKAAIFHQPTISHLESSNSIVVVVKAAAAATNTVVVEVPTTPFKRQANSLSKLI